MNAQPSARKKSRILLSTSGTLGDILVMIPILAGIRELHRDSEIILFNKHASSAAVSPLGVVRRAGLVDRIDILSPWRLRLLQILSFLPYPGRKKFDLVYFLQRDGRSLKRRLQRNIPFLNRISRGGVRGAVHLEPLDDPMKTYPRMAELLLARINWNNPEPVTPGSPYLSFSAEDRARAEEVLKRLRFPSDCVPFVCCVGGKQKVSHWPLEKYRSLLMRVIKETNARPVFMGGPGDAEDIRCLMNSLPEGSSFYAETLTNDLWGSICFMSLCAFYLGNDTGSLHMAAAAGIPCIAVCSSHDHAGLWFPWSSGSRVFRCEPPPACTGCRRQHCPKGSPAPCIDAIGPDEVFDAVREQLPAR